MIWLIIAGIFIPFAAALLLFPLEKKQIGNFGLFSAFAHALSFTCFLMLWQKFDSSHAEIYSIPWIPSAGVHLSFLVDGLSLYFGFLVAGVGILVNIYANYYMDPESGSLARFYFYFNFFATSMLGAVFSNNLLVMYLFWEMTSVASFLLIAFDYLNEHTNQTSRTILLLVLFSSLFLLFGIILIGLYSQTFEWTLIVSQERFPSENNALSWLIVIFFLIGIFGKSAQIPLHFWLPQAMVAPTPVSAYLHAATMVKLGVYLTARMYPLFVSHPLWFPAITTISFMTMLVGAAMSLISNDMKQLLAYATVSQLGAFLGLYGIGEEVGVAYDLVHIFNHALYKGSLFMVAGIIAHATGIRDIRQLGGLWRTLPFTMAIFAIATAAMIGVPGTTGFVSKELILRDVMFLSQQTWSGIVILGVLITSLIIKVAFSLRFFFHIFFDKAERAPSLRHTPGIAVQVPALILSGLALIFGLWPPGLENLLSSFFVSGLHQRDLPHLSIWHGWTLEILLSFAILIVGAGLFLLAEKKQFWKVANFLPDFNAAWLKILNFITKSSETITLKLFSPQPTLNLAYVFFGVILSSLCLLKMQPFSLMRQPAFDLLRTSTVFFMMLITLCIPVMRNWLAKLIALSISGMLVTLLFVLFKGPDLAMAQLLVEVISIFILLALFWGLLKRGNTVTLKEKIYPAKVLTAAAAGICVGIVALGFGKAPFSPAIKDSIVQATLQLDKFSNIVNVVLIDFRGFDTLGETTVLVIASLGVVGVLFRKAAFSFSRDQPRILLLPSTIMAGTIPFLFFLVNTLALYFLFRGHNFPGGGFIGGLAGGTSFILISLCFQQNDIIKMMKINSVKLCLAAFLLILVSSAFPLLSGHPFLFHHTDFPINTQLLFEGGIFLVVLCMSIIVVFSIRGKTLQKGG